MSFGFINEGIYPGFYWGSCGYPLGYSVGCGCGRTYSRVGYGFGYGYCGFWPFDYRRCRRFNFH
uniref:Keratin-associated protein 8-1 n=1 Tax=Catagonus wagneri TaxID=51154 RepID=A0A8C3YBG4_9CETA